MASKYKPKKLKFSGEESFMVPKEGEKFVLAVGADSIALATQNAENIEVAPLEPISVTNPNVVVSDTQISTPPPTIITVPDWNTMDCATIQSELAKLEYILTVSRFVPEVRNQYEAIIASGKDILASKCNGGGSVLPPDGVPPAPPVITEPSWSSLSCDQVKSELSSLQSQYELGAIAIGKENYINIGNYIQNGKKYYEANCVKTTSGTTDTPSGGGGSVLSGGGVGAPPITTITTTGTPIIATASSGGLGLSKVGGFGGGGVKGGEAPQAKKEMNWWWLLLVAGGVYFLTRKD